MNANEAWVETARIGMWFWLSFYAAGSIGCIVTIVKNWSQQPTFALSVVSVFFAINTANLVETTRAVVNGGPLSYGHSIVMTTAVIIIGILTPYFSWGYKAFNKICGEFAADFKKGFTLATLPSGH
jgi:hypothetical protein